jgi:hypothetical protein
MSLPQATVLELRQMLLNDKPYTSIMKQLQISRGVISKYRRIFGIPPKIGKGGRPAKLTAQDRRRIVRAITSGEVDTAPQAKRALGLAVCTQTVRNALQGEGLNAYVKSKKPLLQPKTMRARLRFAKKYRYWTSDDWARVIFSDETKINRMGSDGRLWCYRKRGERPTKRTCQATVKHGGGNTMVWGCMTMQGVGNMCNIDGTMYSEDYVAILDSNLLPTAIAHNLRRGGFIFQQDNDPKHTSKLAKDWFQDHRVTVLDWPANSPDLNPIEHLWDHLKRQLNGYERVPTSIHELKGRIEVEWNKIPRDVCVKLIESIPRRIEAVIKAKGGYTKY